jgi:hypothetical protein
MFKKTIATLIVTCSLACAADFEATVGRPQSKKLWWASVATLAAASAADAGSSWGRQEMNPLLRGSNGRFSTRGIQLKSAIVGGVCLGQWLLLRRHPKAQKRLGAANFGMAALTAGAVIHNTR